jgi:hypothetical protein
MNLPLVLDIALGLIFIYLITSLLAAEIQELITTILQWRAEHLKRSIEILLTGDNKNDPAYQRFTDELYRSPLVKALNQEAKGLFANFFRQMIHRIGDLYRLVTGTKNVFNDQRSGPSYMPAETFAVTLLQQLDIKFFSQKLSESAINQFVDNKLTLVEEVLTSLRNSIGDDDLLQNEFQSLRQNLQQIVQNFVWGRSSLAISIDSITEQLSRFIDNTEAALADNNHCEEIIRKRLPYLKQSIFMRHLEPTIAEALTMILDPANQQNLPPQIAEIIARIKRNNPLLPDQLKQNLIALSQQAVTEAQTLDEGVVQLQKQVEVWFDRSMERASGVYRRNAKGIAILIGFAIAIATNADTFHIVNRLSRDTILRNSIVQAADRVIEQTTPISAAPISAAPISAAPISATPSSTTRTPAPAIDPQPSGLPSSGPNAAVPSAASSAALTANLQEVKNAVNTSIEGLLLPLGWNETNIQQQTLENADWRIPWLRSILGWLVTGIAISMGANFWYDLLGKVIRVRNTGGTNTVATKGSNSSQDKD